MGGDGSEVAVVSRVLVIDDSPGVLEVIKAHLAEEPVEVRYAPDGVAGLELARAWCPDVILLDVEMPGVDGFETCRRIKSDERLMPVPVILMTGTAGTAEKVLGLELGATDYLSKPFDAAELRARVRAGLRLSQMSRLLATKARVDAVTGLWNADYFLGRLSAEVSLSTRTGRPVGVVVVGVDHFGRLNVEHGTAFGDAVLRDVAGAFAGLVREQDVLCRAGGSDLGVICPATDEAGAAVLAKRLCEAVSRMRFEAHGSVVHLTASSGVSVLPGSKGRSAMASGDVASVLLEAARAALMSAKAAGRACVMTARETDYPWSRVGGAGRSGDVPSEHARTSELVSQRRSSDAA